MNINWYPGHMVKTKRQIVEDLKLIDVIVEILDARIPMASQNPDIQNEIKDKPKIVVLNKCDLADENITNSWISYFKEKENVTAIAVDSNSGKGINEVIKNIQIVYENNNEKYIKKGRIGKAIRVMIIGIPNVGKSSFINRISNRTSAKVGNKPGVTKQKQWIRLQAGIELLDTPGILWPKFEDEQMSLNMAYVGTIGQNAIDVIDIAFYLLKYLLSEYKEKVLERYKLDIKQLDNILLDEDVYEGERIIGVRDMIAKKIGAILSGGRIDEEKVSNVIVNDFQNCKLGKISLERPKK